MRSPDVHLTYLVCATPRSGSTLLCEMLRRTGIAGQPLEHFEILRHSGLPRQPREYFAQLDAPEVLATLPATRHRELSSETPERWWSSVLAAGTTANGVWGGKLMWGHIDDLLARMHELPGLAGADLSSALERLLGDPRLVFVSRADKTAQAISLWRAVQTEAWRAGGEGESDRLIYDFRAIDHLRDQLESQEMQWRRWLGGTDMERLEITYEELDSHAPAAVARVVRALGLDTAALPSPPLKRQRDELSAAWAQRYEHERGRAA